MNPTLEDLDFKNGNPGAVQYGNFINYYQFHPPEQRVKHLPIKLLVETRYSNDHSILDIGCNAGNLTFALYKQFKSTSISGCKILGIDIDPVLIKRAKETFKNKNISFHCMDIMNDEKWNDLKARYFRENQISKFDVVCCFSITMWIHLNNGDEGLKRFLKEVSKIGSKLVIEPQPWKCYKQAVKRLKLANAEFLAYKDLKIREFVDVEIRNYLITECNMKLEYESEKTDWGRKLLIFSLN